MKEKSSESAPAVVTKSASPPGVLPRHTQAWVIVGISLLMVIVMTFWGRNSPKSGSNVQPPPSPIDPNQARIKDYELRIEEQARKLRAEQDRLLETKDALGLTPDASDAPSGGAGSIRGAQPQSPPADSGSAPAVRELDWIEADKKKREYQSLFTSSLVESYRSQLPSQLPSTGRGPGITGAPPPDAASWRFAEGLDVGTRFQPDASNTTNEGEGSADYRSSYRRATSRDAELNRAGGKKYRLFEGTVIETVLMNRLDGAFSGPVNCMVTTNLYSHDHQHLLIPQGTKIFGHAQRVETFGQQRLALAFHRLIMPDGYSASLDKFQGLNQVGETGLRDQINHHYLQVFGVSIAIGAIAGLSQANTRSGFDTSAADAYRQGVAASLSQSSLRILDRYLNVLPTFTIREGHRVKVYLSEDLVLPDYDKHEMPGDL
jgi:type IV secretory pathway VirB10-like protein